jgi:hypothetical protein
VNGYFISDPISVAILVAFLVWMGRLVYPVWKNSDVSSNTTPNLLTTLGILGTFVGICWGLFNFDVRNLT